MQVHVCHLSQYSLFGSIRPQVRPIFNLFFPPDVATTVREAEPSAPVNATSMVLVAAAGQQSRRWWQCNGVAREHRQ